MTCGRQGGQGRIDDITGKGLRTAVALSTASYSHLLMQIDTHVDPPHVTLTIFRTAGQHTRLGS